MKNNKRKESYQTNVETHIIGEIPPQTPVTITAYLNGVSMDFESIVCMESAAQTPTKLMVEAVRKEDETGTRVLNFGGVRTELTATIDNRAYRFRIQELTITPLDGRSVYVLTSTERKTSTNRRMHVRIPYCSSAWLQPSANKPAYEGTTRDISISGLSLIIHKPVDFVVGEVCSVSILGDNDVMFPQLKGSVVRCEPSVKSVDTNGCNPTLVCIKFAREYECIVGFIARRQREELRRLRDKGKV